MTHELKTPISTISLASQMMADKTIPGKDKNIGHLARIISDESMRLKFQVEKVLQMAIFERMKTKLSFSSMDIHKIITTAADNFTLQIEARNGKIRKDFQASNPVAMIDEIHFLNAISNLIDNAIKYSIDKPEIVISTRQNRKGIIISVEDNGIGISPEKLKLLFKDNFYTSRGTNNESGTGLGLIICDSLVKKSKGYIKIESEENHGTMVVVSLPSLN